MTVGLLTAVGAENRGPQALNTRRAGNEPHRLVNVGVVAAIFTALPANARDSAEAELARHETPYDAIS